MSFKPRKFRKKAEVENVVEDDDSDNEDTSKPSTVASNAAATKPQNSKRSAAIRGTNSYLSALEQIPQKHYHIGRKFYRSSNYDWSEVS